MVKKTILLCIAVFSLLLTQAQQASNINGTFSAAPYQKVSLFKVYNGRLVELATSTPGSKGQFAFRFTPEYEGLYLVGAGSSQNQQGLHRFYFKGGEELNLILSKQGYELTGKNSKENQALYAWDKQSATFKGKGTSLASMTTYVDFFPEVEGFKNKVAEIGKSVKTGNPKFDTLFPRIVDFDFAYYTISYLYMPRTAHPSKEEMSAYYTSFNPDRYLTDELLTLPYGDRFMSILVFKKVDLSSRPSFEDQVASIPSDILKGQFVVNRLEGARSYNDFLAMSEQYGKHFTLEEQKQRVSAVGAKLVETKTGVPAFKFAFPDVDGKKIALDDLKGKVILLDLWATWCGPCRAEEPHWEKLNEEYKDKAVAFVGVSTDQDKPKWESYVKEKQLKGIQIHAGAGNELSNAYKVNSIPRYILIDKAGNLITADSPRPSDPKLKSLLDEWLKK
ncbi:TlpA family protein disulfide reductase [Sphingobacterium yanglingense]|uniref:Thiol-disulfide isomerase/thioredoxin n=1 Tax=Sphingobacterium yanglingense TaxID=1437280 RepID=A0A4R6W424_9SPHI|nr:TlpA disulfide reductase family protein [Sphingobacterium yanglingense]TDQ72229.1 thiol-disulfide isomerase/thioredoxin [Sphingobacterium yanglingense]